MMIVFKAHIRLKWTWRGKMDVPVLHK